MAAYAEFGLTFLESVAGNFALVLWDAEKQRLVAASDPLGLRRLYYCRRPHALIISDSITAIRRHPLVSNKLDETYLSAYLLDNPLSGSKTIYADVSRIPHHSQMVASQGKFGFHRHWNTQRINPTRYPTDADYEAKFRHVFEQVLRDLIGDSDAVALMLSGGLDSSPIAGMWRSIYDREGTRAQLWAFTYTYRTPGYTTEEHYRAAVTQFVDCPSVLCWSDELTDHYMEPQEEPYQFFVTYPSLNLLEQIRASGISLVLTGHGGDEALSGHLPPAWACDPQLVGAIRRLQSRAPVSRPLPEWIVPGREGQVQEAVQSFDRAEWYSDDLDIQYALEPAHHETIRAAALWFTYRLAKPMGLRMAHPFMDRRLVEYLASIPPEQKMRDGLQKSIVRRSMRSLLPEQLLARTDKTSGDPIFHRSLRRNWKLLADLVQAPDFQALGLVDPERFLVGLQQYLVGRKELLTGIWGAISIANWIAVSYCAPLRIEPATNVTRAPGPRHGSGAAGTGPH